MRSLLAVGACAAVLVIGGCGGGGDSASTSTGAATTTSVPAATTKSASPAPSKQSAAGQKEDQSHEPGKGSATKQDSKGDDSSLNAAAKVKVPPISSAPIAGTKTPAPGVKTVKGADDSVQTYGVESDEAARSEATLALVAYLQERLRGEWGAACEALAKQPTEQLEKLAKGLSAQGQKTSGCAEAMAALGGSQGSVTAITEVLSLRTQGDVPSDPSYLIFTAPPGKTFYSMPMYLEGSGWKVGLAVPAELPL